jgi:hypothetical protein
VFAGISLNGSTIERTATRTGSLTAPTSRPSRFVTEGKGGSPTVVGEWDDGSRAAPRGRRGAGRPKRSWAASGPMVVSVTPPVALGHAIDALVADSWNTKGVPATKAVRATRMWDTARVS